MASSSYNFDDSPVPLLPIVVLFMVGVSKIYYTRRFHEQFLAVVAVEAVLAFLIHSYLLPMPSIVPWWALSTNVSSRWIRNIIPKNTVRKTNEIASFRTALLNGPLGPGAYKVVQVIVAIGLWRFLKKEWPAIQCFGNSRKYPGLLEWSILVGISVAVNIVLYTWSRIAKSTGSHKGVDRMVSSTKDRNRLTHRERLLYGSLALINATCEEICFRWFWRSEFAVYLSSRHGSNNKYSNYICFNANVAQAAVFGSLHYYGIPSGLPGVCLTFVYGWIMGVLMEQFGDGGLFLPIIAHTIADYYLFSSVARGKAAGTKAKSKTSS